MESGRVRQIGPYRLLQKLGQGGMSSVFLSEDAEGRKVALKLLNVSLEMDPQFRKRFQREAEITLELDHPGIVKTLAWEDDPEAGVYLLMEFVSGGNLRRRIEENQALPDLKEVLEWFAPVFEGLEYAHGRGIIHRDLKPENLLFATSEHLKIADFGVARVETGSRLTRTGVLPGTPEYMAPEQFSEAPLTPAADFYALATVIYEVLTGTTPFRSDNLAAVLHRQAFEPPSPPSAHRGELPAYLDRVLLKALAKKPEDRYPSGREFFEALSRPPRTAPSRTDVSGDLPTRQVLWRETAGSTRRKLPWTLIWLLWMGVALVWIARLHPPPIPPDWLESGVGWQPAAVGQQLCSSVLWNGIEIALLGPEQNQAALARARFAAAQWMEWLPASGAPPLKGQEDGPDYLLSLKEDWVRVTPQMGANLKASPKQIGEYWSAIIKDISSIREGREPRSIRELERERPLRLDGTGPRYPHWEQLFQRCRFLQRQGPLPTEVIVEALESLSASQRDQIVLSARSVPLEVP